MSMGDVEAVVFDKDGTLLDYVATWMPLNHKAALAAAGGDQGLADRLLAAGGYDGAAAVAVVETCERSAAAGRRVEVQLPTPALGGRS